MPVTPSGFEEQLRSRASYEVLVAVEEAVVAVPVAVAVAVADANEALSCATLRSASFAWLALTPVPAARPMTAAESSAMMAHRTNSNTGQPQRVPFLFPPPRDGTAPAATGLV